MKQLTITVLLLLLCACSKGVPNDKREYVGYWKSENVSLEIQVNGSVMFVDKRTPNKTETVRGNISKFVQDDFVVGLKPFDTRFRVEKPPYQDGANKKMIVNDVELTQYVLPPEGNKTMKL
jgi:lipoprotein-anchoring transpeptidase ErfK/SrfK